MSKDDDIPIIKMVPKKVHSLLRHQRGIDHHNSLSTQGTQATLNRPTVTSRQRSVTSKAVLSSHSLSFDNHIRNNTKNRKRKRPVSKPTNLSQIAHTDSDLEVNRKEH